MKYYGYVFIAALCFTGTDAVGGNFNQDAGVSTSASEEGPAQRAYAPEKGRGPAVIVISGQSGPDNYRYVAVEVARLGYYAVLLDGNDILGKGVTEGKARLKKAIERARRSPLATPGKTAVIGFSLGGGGALRYAAGMPDLVDVVIAYYPFTSFRAGAASLVPDFQVPILVMAGGQDHWKSCCLIESAREMEAAAKKSGANFELVVYPSAGHDFDHMNSSAYRRDDADDAWRRTAVMLRRYLPVQ